MKRKISSVMDKVLPFLAGGTIAAVSAAIATYCTVPQNGKCSVCGSCLVAVGSLAGWAVVNGKNANSVYSASYKK